MEIIYCENDTAVTMPKLTPPSEAEQTIDAGLPSVSLEGFRASCPPSMSLQEWENFVDLARKSSDFIEAWSARFRDVTSRRTKQYCDLLLHDTQDDDDMALDFQSLSLTESNNSEQVRQKRLQKMAFALKNRLEEDMQFQESLLKMQTIEWTHLNSLWHGATHHQARPNEMPGDPPEIHDEEEAAKFFLTHEWYDILDMFRAECLRRATPPIAYSPMWAFFMKLQELMDYTSMEHLQMMVDMDQELSQQTSEDLCGIYL